MKMGNKKKGDTPVLLREKNDRQRHRDRKRRNTEMFYRF